MKLFVFLPIIIFFGVFGLLILGFIGVIAKIALKTSQSSWEGKVTDKLYNQDKEEDNHINHLYTLVVNTNEGVTRKIAVSKEMYDSCEIGDKIVKPKGALNPSKA